MKPGPKESAEERSGSAGHVPKGGSKSRHEGGFAEGEYGRGPMPYHGHMSGKKNGHGTEGHVGSAGRGDGGITGKHDSFVGRSEDVKHPQSHDEFECLGAK